MTDIVNIAAGVYRTGDIQYSIESVSLHIPFHLYLNVHGELSL